MDPPPGPHSYVVLWTQDYCRRLRRSGDLGNPLEVVYGGSHTSQPLLSRYGVGGGDTLYAVSVAEGRLLVVGGMTVVAIVPWLQYVERHLGVSTAWLAEAASWRVADELSRRHPEWGHRLPWGCTVEAAVGEGGAGLALDRTAPTGLVTNLRFVSKQGRERPLRQVVDGRISSVNGLQGHVLRLRADAADAFRALTWPS
jgi:hypothetical protein